MELMYEIVLNVTVYRKFPSKDKAEEYADNCVADLEYDWEMDHIDGPSQRDVRATIMGVTEAKHNG